MRVVFAGHESPHFLALMDPPAADAGPPERRDAEEGGLQAAVWAGEARPWEQQRAPQQEHGQGQGLLQLQQQQQ